MDIGTLRPKRPFPPLPISLNRDFTRFKEPHEPAANHPRTRCQPWAEAGRISAHSGADRPGAEFYRARNLLGDVERALLVQILAAASAGTTDQSSVGDPGAGRERRRDRHRRRP